MLVLSAVEVAVVPIEVTSSMHFPIHETSLICATILQKIKPRNRSDSANGQLFSETFNSQNRLEVTQTSDDNPILLKGTAGESHFNIKWACPETSFKTTIVEA